MQIFIMRHGEASMYAASDKVRELTDRGKTQSIAMGAWLEKQSIIINKVLVSPYLRAQQTLEAVKEKLTLPKNIETVDDIAPDGSEQQMALYLFLNARQGIKTILIISHRPLVDCLVLTLCPAIKKPPIFTTS